MSDDVYAEPLRAAERVWLSAMQQFAGDEDPALTAAVRAAVDVAYAAGRDDEANDVPTERDRTMTATSDDVYAEPLRSAPSEATYRLQIDRLIRERDEARAAIRAAVDAARVERTAEIVAALREVEASHQSYGLADLIERGEIG